MNTEDYYLGNMSENEASSEVERIESKKRSLGGYLGRVSIHMKELKTCLDDPSRANEIQTALNELQSALNNYEDCYQSYILEELATDEFNRVKEKFEETRNECETTTKLANERLKKGKSNSTKSRLSSRSRKLREKIEMKKLLLQQEEEIAQHRMDLERKKIELEYEQKARACKLKFQVQIAEKEAELLEERGSESDSCVSEEYKGDVGVMPPMSQEEKLMKWTEQCDPIPDNPRPDTPKLMEGPSHPKDPIPERKPQINDQEAPPSSYRKTPFGFLPVNSTDIMLKLTMLQAMQPVKFSGNPSDFPNFRKRLRDNLEDEILSDSQKVEFLPKFLSGEAFEVVERVSGCSYSVIVDILEDRYGQPATVAASCIDNLTRGPRLNNHDYKGLRDFAEQLESSSKKLVGEYAIEASTISNMKQIVRRLPQYLVNKWGDVSYKIREKGGIPKISDLADYVKRQAAIKNDPGFVNLSMSENKGGGDKRPEQGGKGKNYQKQTSVFKTDMEGSPPETTMGKQAPIKTCPCCQGEHRLSDCANFKGRDLPGRWRLVKEKRLCHICLRPGHMRDRCHTTTFCNCKSERKHHTLLHNPPRAKDDPPKELNSSAGEGTTEGPPRRDHAQGTRGGEPHRQTEQYATFSERATGTVLLHVVPVKLIAPNGNSLTTYGLLDNGSRGTMISSEVSAKLEPKGHTEEISITTMMGSSKEQIEVVEFELQHASGEGDRIPVTEGLVTKKFNVNEKCLPKDIDRDAHPHLRDIEIPSVDMPKVSVLIGKDVGYAHEVFEVRRPATKASDLKALRGPLGWVITGTLQGETSCKEVNLNFADYKKELQHQIERFWDLESFGTKSVGTDKGSPSFISHHLSREDRKAIDKLEKTITKRDGHYETGLLWRDDDVTLPNNRNEADKRLNSLKRKFSREPGLEEKYRAAMEKYITKGHARKLSPEEAQETGPRTWYLPHFAVTNINKPGKLRIIFDAASEYQGTSLNKNLLHGPDCTNSLTGVLLRFREDNVALVADIEGMFLQVGVREEDQDSLRFLWWDKSSDDPPEEYAMNVHVFGATDSPCAANWTLKKTTTDNAGDFGDTTIETVLHNFYVDDVLKSVDTSASAVTLANELTELCGRGGFNLTKFMSNSREVLAEVPIEKRAAPTLDLDLDELPVERALGVRWNVETDTFGFKVSNTEKADTMRGVLSTISSVFDPLNFAAPVIMRGKQIMQALWRRKAPWDEPLSGDILRQWQTWKRELVRLEDLSIPRCYFSRPDHEGVGLQLHHFSDASEAGYGSVSYLRIEYPDGMVECAFVAGKSRNAPIKGSTIPRLELQGALLATRVDQAVRRELDLKPDRVVFWTDSMITLNYINNETRRFQTYVANRVTEIREATNPDQWRHCPGKLNPSDEVSRGLTIDEFLRDERWLNDPSFLRESEDQWPDNKFDALSEESLEIKKEVFFTDLEPGDGLEKLLTDTSDWMKTIRKVAWVMKFVEWLKTRKHAKPTEKTPGESENKLSPDDIERAKRRIAVLVQRESFPEEVKALKAGKEVNVASAILKLKPVMKGDEVMRVGGRISMAPMSDDAKNPMILPKQSHITTILIRHLHESNGHCGVEQVLSLLREQFWIVKARVAIKAVLGRCIHCRKQRRTTLKQEMGDLPRIRMIPYEPPFTYTGIDYFGPLYVKRGRGRVTEKRWGAIFVCMNSRAVHLELAKSLETDDFILALMRFLNRRGHVVELWSDNGSNFVGADREIREHLEGMDHDKIGRECSAKGCKWIFNPPGATHMSGVWERMVRVVKRSLKAILGKNPLNDEVLTTVFTEAERIANSRPLTRNPENPDDEDPLTPNHFLNVRPTMNLPTDTDERADKYSRKRWRQAQLLANHYWRRWLKEYIPSLQVRSKWNRKQRNLHVGDIVLVADDNVGRNNWPLARVINVFPGVDGLVRSAEVRGKGTTYKRPVTKLCLLEAEDEDV
ncbi:uncharacterized protein LOC125571976 [Nematostella vectensis]|uniref:uncharacterized protein LOC116613948 n=1 Tax=Nematostella vectensis TaxID=45351 RepID=UPI0020774508|nr:uncharacterized protein LOC116613948 [Nematostella vectensis]XP_048587900.1 uncharacterized protein LOC125571976 [Nematostella vectensis]